MTDTNDRRIALGDELRLLRETAGLSGKDLAEQLRWQASKISRIENAKQAVTDSDIVAICSALKADAEALRNELRSIRAEDARWNRQLRVGHSAVQARVGRAERDARRIRAFSLTMVPGLVQTAEFARAVFTALARFHDSPPDTDAAVRARLERQQVLYAEGKQIELLMTDFALRHPIAPPHVMRAQVDRLLAVQGLPSLRFGIIPSGRPIPPAVGHSFTIKDDLAAVELINTEISTREPGDLALYNAYFEALWEQAEVGDAARAVLLRSVEVFRS